MSFNLKSSIFLPLCILFIITQNFPTLEAKEPLLATLETVYSNSMQRFKINSNSFVCQPYGVISLERLYLKSQKGSLCRESIEEFYSKSRYLSYYTESILKIYQRYHIELKESECVVYARGERTLSELLLSKGLAIKRAHFNDKEFRYKFEKSSRTAKENKKGLWNTSIEKYCNIKLQK